MTRSALRALLNDPDGSKQRARRQRYRRPCSDCGVPTDGSGGFAYGPKRCSACRKAYEKSEAYRLSRQEWPPERCLEAIRWWVAEFGEIPSGTDFNPTHCRALGDFARAARADRLIRAGRIPWFVTVVRRFGSWNAAIATAGFTPRPRGGVAANRSRDRRVRAAAARREKAAA